MQQAESKKYRNPKEIEDESFLNYCAMMTAIYDSPGVSADDWQRNHLLVLETAMSEFDADCRKLGVRSTRIARSNLEKRIDEEQHLMFAAYKMKDLDLCLAEKQQSDSSDSTEKVCDPLVYDQQNTSRNAVMVAVNTYERNLACSAIKNAVAPQRHPQTISSEEIASNYRSSRFVQRRSSTKEKHQLQLLRFTDDGRVDLLQDNLRFVLECDAARDRKVAVISIMGAYRRGKSFLLNFFLRYLKHKGTSNWIGDETESLVGFNWKFGVERTTTGVVVWPEVFVIGDVAVLLVDTQGTFDKETSIKEIRTIIAFTAMFSSVQIFNYHERLDSQDLMNLEYFLQYGKLLEENKISNDIKIFQDIIFLIRDWHFGDETPYGFDGGDSYLNAFISPGERKEDVSSELSGVGDMLHVCFNRVRCFLMPHPGDEVSENPNFSGQLKDIDPVFRTELGVFMKSLLALESITPKTIAGRSITGRQLMQHVNDFANALNSGLAPEPNTMLTSLSENLALSNVKECRELYNTMMRDGMSGDFELIELHEMSRERALQRYGENPSVGPPNQVESFRSSLLEQIEESFDRFVEKLFSSQEISRSKKELKIQQEEQRRLMEERETTLFLMLEQEELTRENEAIGGSALLGHVEKLTEENKRQREMINELLKQVEKITRLNQELLQRKKNE